MVFMDSQNPFSLPELSKTVQHYALKFSQDFSVATNLFQHHNQAFEEEYQNHLKEISPIFPILELKADFDLFNWEKESGRKQNYTPKELAEARARMQVLNNYRSSHKIELALLNGVHQSIIAVALETSGLSEKLRKQHEVGKKLAVVETSARLSPCLTFVGSSNYLESMMVPYGKKARRALGEKQVQSLVSSEAVEESVRNAQRLFGVDYVLAETSAAPRDEVPKSKRKPEVYLCALMGGNTKIMTLDTTHQVIDTPFREEFNCRVRESMYFALKKMYGG